MFPPLLCEASTSAGTSTFVEPTAERTADKSAGGQSRVDVAEQLGREMFRGKDGPCAEVSVKGSSPEF
jgi:hypothetical protein